MLDSRLYYPVIFSLFLLPLSSCLHDSRDATSVVDPKYTITWLGVLPSNNNEQAFNQSIPSAINENGQVVGTSYKSNKEFRAFLWEDGVLLELPINSATGSSQALDINDSGHIVGMENSIGFPQPAVWENNKLTILPVLNPDGETQFYASCINNNFRIGGFSGNPAFTGIGLENLRALAWNPRLNADSIDEFDSAQITDVNGDGHFIGMLEGETHKIAAHWENGSRLELGFLPGAKFDSTSIALGLNNKNQIVGANIQDRGYAHEGITLSFIWNSGNLTELSDLPGGLQRSEASGINDSGLVVGFGYSSKGQRATIWPTQGNLRDLNDLVVLKAGHSLRRAIAINNKGQIVGEGRGPNGLVEAFLLTPLP